MFKFIKRGPHVSAERQRQQKELFAFKKTVPHGFPHRPSAFALDPTLGLIAIGTRNGVLRIYGKPGVEYYAQFENEAEIREVCFIEKRGQLICLCDDNTIHLWEINNNDGNDEQTRISCLEKVKSFDNFSHEEGNLKQITTISIHSTNDVVLIGTHGGTIYMLDIETFELTDQIIYQDVVLQNVPDDYKKSNPGEVEVIAEQPLHPDKFLIGYNRGLLVLWDNKSLTAENFYFANQQLESISWLNNGEQFMSTHNDGSYIVWRVSDSLHPSESPKTPYGPFPCKPIHKIIWKTVHNGDDYIIFNGGLPRASFGDKNTVSILQGTPETGKHHVLDFSSKVVDFFVIDGENESDNPQALLVLLEEEMVAIDLTHSDWLQFRLPYLSSIHSSAITCCQHYAEIPDELYNKMVDAGKRQMSGKYTTAEWPIQGGDNLNKPQVGQRDLLVTGHEDGSVSFWDSSGVALHHVYSFNMSKLYVSPDDDIAPIDGDDIPLDGGDAEVEWPPFRKVGVFDPFSDDPRQAIRKINLCPLTGVLSVAGTAGQVVVFDLVEDETEKRVNSAIINIVGDRDGFVWKGHDQLNLRMGALKFEAGFQPRSVIQLTPPATVTALTFHSEWGVVAAGTAHGFGLYDYVQNKVVLSKCTLNTSDLTATAGGDALIARRKSFKKSLRESFRRLRKGRSQRGAKKSDKTGSSSSSTPAASSPTKSADDGKKSPAKEGDIFESRPVERQVEARTLDDSMGSVVRCLYLAPGFIASSTSQLPTLWVGTNAGAVYIYAITLPSEEKRSSEDVSSQLAKEIQLKHRAPVVFIQIIDSTGYPIPDAYEVKKGRSKAPSSVGTHRVVICSEEQFKLFTLPSLKPYCKFKLTAHEGSRARRLTVGNFVSKSDEKHVEYCVMCVSNQGDISIYTIADLKRQMQRSCVKREDINGITSLVFTRNAEGFYLQSPCEFKRFTLSARKSVTASCVVDIPEGVRPKKPSETIPPIAAASVVAENPEEGEKKENEEKADEATSQVKPEINQTEVANENPSPEGDPKPTNHVDDRQETPTSGIEEEDTSGSGTVHEASEITDAHHHEPTVNGTTNGNQENDEYEDDIGELTNDSRLMNDISMDITIDSVKDHLTTIGITEKHEQKKILTPSPPAMETLPIINSHED